MKLLPHQVPTRTDERGAALMLSFLVLIVLILIVQQISYSAKTDARVARNEETLLAMDQAIESVLLETYETLESDVAVSADGGGAGAGFAGAADSGGEGGEQASDSREDEWAKPKRTEINDLQLRVLVQDEDSKFNVLSILTENPDEAEKAFDRLTRVIENARKGTRLEIDGGTARHMAETIREFMTRRADQTLPRPDLLTDDPNDYDRGLPLTLRELVAVDTDLFPRDVFRDLRDEDGTVVHSLSSFLTVTSCLRGAGEEPESASGATDPEPEADPDPDPDADPDPDPDEDPDGDPGEGGGQEADPSAFAGGAAESDVADGRVNLNTAPRAVLEALLDDRDVPYTFWPDVIEYRNEPQEEDEDYEEDDFAELDEFGEEHVPKQYFASVDALGEIGSWANFEPIQQAELRGLLKTQSSVFSIYVTARRPSGEERVRPASRREDIEREEAEGQGLVRTVRSVVWRRSVGGETEIVPIVRWEVLDYVPYEVLDFPREDR